MSVPNSISSLLLARCAALRPPRSTSEQGLTLLECLIAVAIIGLTIAVIAPPLVIATATRVQNRRAEQAMQVAQGEVDRIRIMVMEARHTPARLPAVAPGASLQAVAAPSQIFGGATNPPVSSSNPNCANAYTGAQVPFNSSLAVDIDGDCQPDFLMQTFRSQGVTPTAETVSGQLRPSTFNLGVRVYSIVAKDGLGNLQATPASLQITNGQANQQSRPLAVVYTPMNWSEQSGTFCQYYTTNGGNQPSTCPP